MVVQPVVVRVQEAQRRGRSVLSAHIPGQGGAEALGVAQKAGVTAQLRRSRHKCLHDLARPIRGRIVDDNELQAHVRVRGAEDARAAGHTAQGSLHVLFPVVHGDYDRDGGGQRRIGRKCGRQRAILGRPARKEAERALHFALDQHRTRGQ